MSEPQRVINFMALRKHGAVFSIAISIISIVSFFWQGLNFGLDFTGGTLVEVEFAQPVAAEDVRISLEQAGINEAVVQHFGSEHDVLIRVPPQKGESQALLADHVKSALAEKYPGVDLRRSEFVGPAVGAELRESRRAVDGGRIRGRHDLHDVPLHQRNSVSARWWR